MLKLILLMVELNLAGIFRSTWMTFPRPLVLNPHQIKEIFLLGPSRETFHRFGGGFVILAFGR
jgi:hypothetical protein